MKEFLYYSARLRWVPANMLKSVEDSSPNRTSRKRLIKTSGGYQQRVGIAQAIIHKPEIVIFDNPNGLDRIKSWKFVTIRFAQERTIILSTHILTEVQATCDNIMMIEQGKLVFMGTVDEFDNYIAPNTIYLRMGNPPTVEELAKVENVQGVEDLGNRKFRVRFENAQEAMDSIVKQSVVHDWHLSEIRVEKTSLDKIFSELSKKIQ
ncbi:MAG: ATP-binding cassette domain-containing protein [Butyricimonas faecihominis]